MARPKKHIDWDQLRIEGKLCTHPSHNAKVPLSCFVKNKQTADGYHAYCQACRLKLRRAAKAGKRFTKKPRRSRTDQEPLEQFLVKIRALSCS